MLQLWWLHPPISLYIVSRMRNRLGQILLEVRDPNLACTHAFLAIPPGLSKKGFSEIFIHSEIYKTYPAVKSVVNSHSLSVIPFSISQQPLCACSTWQVFLGRRCPSGILTLYTLQMTSKICWSAMRNLAHLWRRL